jgi:hypothetical protein
VTKRLRGESRSFLWRCLAVVALWLSLLAPRTALAAGSLETGSSYAPPVDAPGADHHGLELPPPPAGYTVTDHGWIDFAYAPAARERVQPLLRDADAIRAELSVRLGERVLNHVHVRIARTPGEMATLAPEGAPYPKYASGVAYSEIGLVLLTLTPVEASGLHDLGEVFRHELAHVALGDAVVDAGRVPHWFNEGLAVHLSRESTLVRMKTLSTATLSGRLVPLARLEHGFPSDALDAELAYAESADVVRFLLRQEDKERFPSLIGRIRSGQSFELALRDAYGMDLFTLEYEWREDVAKRYSFWPVFFSGSLIWVGVLVLFALGYRKRRQQSRMTLERWAMEEAYTDLRSRAQVPATAVPRMRIVLPTNEPIAPPTPELPSLPPPPVDADVPRVQHAGRWHTLH